MILGQSEHNGDVLQKEDVTTTSEEARNSFHLRAKPIDWKVHRKLHRKLHLKLSENFGAVWRLLLDSQNW